MIILFYNEMVSLSNTTSITNSNAKFIVATFNESMWKILHIITIYKPPKLQVPYFVFILKSIFQKVPMDCPTIIIRDFNINMLTNTLQSTKLQNFMDKYGLQLVFFETITTHNT